MISTNLEAAILEPSLVTERFKSDETSTLFLGPAEKEEDVCRSRCAQSAIRSFTETGPPSSTVIQFNILSSQVDSN